MRKFWIVFIIIAVVIGGGIGLLWKAISSLEDPAAAGGGILHWQVSGALPETIDDSFVGRLQQGEVLTFRQAIFGLDRAADDPDVAGLLLELQGLSVSWAQLEELQAAVARFRAAGKPVWSVVTFAGNADYALAAAADRVAMVPEGNLMVLGVAAELAFLKDTLAKVGIEAEFLHVGEYKSAPEQLTRSEPSDANRIMTTALVEARYQQLIDLIAAGRGASREAVAKWIDVGMYDGEAALAAGLVDTLLDVATVRDDLLPDEEVTDFAGYARAGGDGGARHEVALVLAEGAIMPGESRQDPLQGPVVGSETVIERLAEAREDEDVEAVVLRVDSPGGSAMASDLIWREIARVREVKPVVVSMGGYAASGGYYIACGADSIFADRGTLTGSIGVFAGKMDWSGLFDKIDLNREFVTRGENAMLWSDATGFSPAQRELFQAQLERFYRRFLVKVATGRGLDVDAVDAVARGRVWTGGQAIDHGLVDGIGGLERALRSAKALIGVAPGDRVRVRTYGVERTWLQRALLDALRSSGTAELLVRPAGPVGWPLPWRAAADDLVGTGAAAALPLLDGRPVAMLTWWPSSCGGGTP